MRIKVSMSNPPPQKKHIVDYIINNWVKETGCGKYDTFTKLYTKVEVVAGVQKVSYRKT